MPWYRSLRVRIFFLIIWLGVGTIFILTTFFLDHERKALQKELEKRGIQIARTLATQCVEPLLYEDRFGLYEVIQNYLDEDSAEGDPFVQYVLVLDRAGEILVEKQRMGSGPYFTGGGQLRTAMETRKLLVSYYDPHTLDIVMPVFVQNHRVGTVRIGVSNRSVATTLGDLRSKVVTYVAIIVLGGVFIGLWLAHRIIHPLRILTQGASRLALGHWGERVEVPAKDEIGQLAHTLNVMSRKIRESLEEIRRTQESLARTERLSALGTLSAGLAHEIKNPLTSIKMILQAMERDPDPRKLKEDIGVMLQEVSQLDQVVSDFLAFARPVPLERKWRRLDEVADEALALLSRHLQQGGIHVHRDLEDSDPYVWIDPAKIKQVLVNLVLNAVQAMPEGGRLWIRILSHESPSEIALEVEDTGPGIPPDLTGRVFDPFVTTKERGTGLGLSVAHRFIAEHGGRIQLTHGTYGGALFRIYLPRGGNRDGNHSGRG